MHVVIAYDISDNKKRLKLFSYLKEKGINSQKSIFECEMEQNTLNDTYRFSQSLELDMSDSVIFYPLCKRCTHHVAILGQGLELIKTDWLIV